MTRFAAMLSAALVLAGCASDPLQDVPRLSDADVSESDIQAAIRAEPEDASQPIAPQRSLITRVFGNGDTAATKTDSSSETDLQPLIVPVDDVVGVDDPLALEPERGGLLGFLRRAADDARAPEAEAPDSLVVAAVPPSATTDAPASPGLFGRANAPGPNDPDYRIVELGTTLPFGTLARVCNVRPNKLGRRVERYPEKRGMYALYDSAPGNTAPHTFYVTGFKDGCARQFTAAVALFGSTETHEQLRYGLPAKVQPYSQTDAAYEKLKSRVCRVPKGRPCGKALPRLSKNTVFVSVYERFGSNPIWKTILIHDGAVVETDIRGN